MALEAEGYDARRLLIGQGRMQRQSRHGLERGFNAFGIAADVGKHLVPADLRPAVKRLAEADLVGQIARAELESLGLVEQCEAADKVKILL